MAFRVRDHEVINNDGHPTMFGHQEKIASVQIGHQVWMAENLRVKYYSNGDPIPTGYSNSEWKNLSTDAYAVYDNDPINETVYGLLYNWYAVNNAAGLAPEGWHVPSNEEFDTLEPYLGSLDALGANEGSKLAGNHDLWIDTTLEYNLENNSEFGTSGFNGLPAGYRQYTTGGFKSLGGNGNFWSSTENSPNARYSRLQSNSSKLWRIGAGNKQSGYSIRCIKDT